MANKVNTKNKSNKKNKKNKIQSEHNKIIKYYAIAVCLIIVLVCIFGSNLNPIRLLSNVYNVEDIKMSIDDVKVGDTINYEANGYTEWQVLYIDKENNTLDIISKDSVEDVSLTGWIDYENALDIFQETAEKYMDGKYAISARSVTQADLANLNFNSYFWTADTMKASVLYNNGYVNLAYGANGYKIVPVVTINVDDSTSLSIGDDYIYSLNGIEEWLVLYKLGTTSISIIPKEPKEADLVTDNHGADINAYISEEIEKYKDDNVTYVRSISSSDLNALRSISYYAQNGKYVSFLTGIQNSKSTYSNVRNGYPYSYDEYLLQVLSFYTYNNYWSINNTNFQMFTYTYGFRPIVTIKYSDELVNQKEVTTDLKVGDNVKYEANAYNNWKVLSIDEENKTVDIISGGVVKNLTFSGKDSYDNISTILQEEVDKYKNGDNVVSARPVEISDLENLKAIKDSTSTKYWLNNQYKYHHQNYQSNVGNIYTEAVNYSIGVAYYNQATQEIQKEWATLEVANEYDMDILSGNAVGPHSYTAGLRPVITLKLSEVEKATDDDINNSSANTNDQDIQEEQNSANNESLNTITDDEILDNKIDSENNNVENNNIENNNDNQENNEQVTDNNEIEIDKSCCLECESEKDNDGIIKFIVINLIVVDIAIVLIVIKGFNIYKKLKK